MRLSKLLEGISCKVLNGDLEVEINAICFDSRKVGKGDVFVAQRGAHVDGHTYIDKAVMQGAVAVVCEEVTGEKHVGVIYVVVENSSEALGWMASRYY